MSGRTLARALAEPLITRQISVAAWGTRERPEMRTWAASVHPCGLALTRVPLGEPYEAWWSVTHVASGLRLTYFVEDEDAARVVLYLLRRFDWHDPAIRIKREGREGTKQARAVRRISDLIVKFGVNSSAPFTAYWRQH